MYKRQTFPERRDLEQKAYHRLWARADQGKKAIWHEVAVFSAGIWDNGGGLILVDALCGERLNISSINIIQKEQPIDRLCQKCIKKKRTD